MSGPLPESALRVARAAEALGLAVDIRVMPHSTRTAAEAAAACGCDVAQIVKSLVFRLEAGDEPVLLLVSGRSRVHEGKVGRLLGDTLVRADAAFVRAATGYAIGGIPPFGHASPLMTLMDEDLLAFDLIWSAAGTPFAVFSAAPKALAAIVNARIVRMA